jgi:hypothetical protein
MIPGVEGVIVDLTQGREEDVKHRIPNEGRRDVTLACPTFGNESLARATKLQGGIALNEVGSQGATDEGNTVHIHVNKVFRQGRGDT